MISSAGDFVAKLRESDDWWSEGWERRRGRRWLVDLGVEELETMDVERLRDDGWYRRRHRVQSEDRTPRAARVRNESILFINVRYGNAEICL